MTAKPSHLDSLGLGARFVNDGTAFEINSFVEEFHDELHKAETWDEVATVQATARLRLALLLNRTYEDPTKVEIADRFRQVLDHGFVRLVDHMGSDLSIARAARVSYAAAWRAGEDQGSDHKLIHYLLKHQHTSPFEAVTITFEAKAPIFVFRQWHRHRTWSFNEVSARYSELPEQFYVPDPSVIGLQSTSNKQARELNGAGNPEAARAIKLACEVAFASYRDLLAAGCPRELARGVLPLNTYSHMFAVVNLRNLFHFIDLRAHAHAQYEIRVYADAMRELVTPIVPVAMAAYAAAKGPQ